MSLIKSTVAYSISNLVLKFGGVLLLPLMTRLLSPDEYGVIGILMAISSLMTIFIGFGLYNPQNKSQSKYKEKLNALGEYLFTQLIVFICVVVIFSVVYIACINFNFVSSIYFDFGLNYYYLILILTLSIFSAFNVLMISFFKMDGKFYFVAIISIISFFIFYGLAFSFIIYFKNNITGYILANILSQAVVSFYLFWKYSKKIRFNWDLSEAKYAIKLGLPVVFTELSGRVVEVTDRLILAKYITMSEVGVYILASTGGRILSVFISGYTNSLYLFLYENIKSKKVIDSYNKYFVVITFVVVIGQILSEPIIPIVFSSDYDNLYLYFSLLLPVFALQYFYFLDFYFHVSEDSKYIPVFSLVISILSVFFNVIFIQKYGVLGAVISSYLCMIVRFIIQVYWIRYKYDIKINYIRFIILSLIQFIYPYITYKYDFDMLTSFSLVSLVSIICCIYIYANLDEIKMVNYDK